MTLILTSLVQLTLLLGAGWAAMRLSRRWTTPAVRHTLGLVTLISTLLLPAWRWLPGRGQLIALAVSASSPATAPLAKFCIGVPWKWLAAIWLVGAVLVILRYLTGLLYVAWQTRAAEPYVNHTLDPMLEVRLAPVHTPLVWGWWRPTLLVPFQAKTWTTGRWRLVLLHEQAHVRRHDLYSILVILAAQAVYWFHPLVWRLGKAMRHEQELACDELVLATADVSPAAYASLLLEWAQNFRGASAELFGCAMVSDDVDSQNLKGRLMQILNPAVPASRPVRRYLPLLLGLLLIAVSVVSAQPPYQIGKDVTAPKLLSKVEPSYDDGAKAEKIQGSVLLQMTVDENGQAGNIEVLRSLDDRLDRNAIAAVQQWRFSPGLKAGVPVPVLAKVEVRFAMK